MSRVLSADWVLPVEAPPIRDGAVVVEDGRIVAIGPSTELGTGTRYEHAAILPGFVNAHTHLEYAGYAGFGDATADFAEWILMHVMRKAKLDWNDALALARLGAAECLASGVSTVGDCTYSGAAAGACAELGLRAIVYLEVFGADAETVLARFEQLAELADGCFSERVRKGVSPHTPYTVGLDGYRACAELGLPVATHLSESPSELAYLMDGSGPWEPMADKLVPSPGTTGTRMLARAGLLGPRLVAAHGTCLDADEIALLAESGAGLAHCPRSNALLGCGIAPLRALLDGGVRVGIGTDSPASAPSFDFFDELRAAVLLARARERRPDALTAAEALELGTLGSARALGLDAEVGSLVPGKRADLTVVSLDGSAYHPWEDPAVAVVFGGSPERVVTTLVDGEAVYERGGFAWHELQRSAASARAKMLGEPLSPAAPPAPAPISGS